VLASFRVVSMLLEFDQRSDALHLPMWIPQSVVPLSLFLIILMSLPSRRRPGHRGGMTRLRIHTET